MGSKASIYFSLKANFISNNFSSLFYGLYRKLEDLFILFSFAGSGREKVHGVGGMRVVAEITVEAVWGCGMTTTGFRNG